MPCHLNRKNTDKVLSFKILSWIFFVVIADSVLDFTVQGSSFHKTGQAHHVQRRVLSALSIARGFSAEHSDVQCAVTQISADICGSL